MLGLGSQERSLWGFYRGTLRKGSVGFFNRLGDLEAKVISFVVGRYEQLHVTLTISL